MRLSNRIRLALGLPFKPENHGDGLWLVDPGPQTQAERDAKHIDPKCELCGEPATGFKAEPPWPGTDHAHTTYTCAAHASYLRGHTWTRRSDGRWVEGKVSHHVSECDDPDGCDGPHGGCSSCGGKYGECGCPRSATAQQYLRWEKNAVYGKVASRQGSSPAPAPPA